MTQRPTLTTIRERNRRKRLIGWVVFYLSLIMTFIAVVYWQAGSVSTFNFASGTLQLTTSKTRYTVGDTVRYTLKNGLSQPVTFVNSCPQEPLYIYSWIKNSWVRIHDTARRSTCVGQPKQHTIPAGGSYTQSFADWPKLFDKPGIYRIVGLATNYTALPYADFQVISKSNAPQTQTQIIIQKIITPIYIPVPSGGDD